MKTAPPGAYREDAAVGTVPVTSVTVAAARADANLENMLLSQKATTPKPSQRSIERTWRMPPVETPTRRESSTWRDEGSTGW